MPTSVRLPNEIEERLDLLAKSTKRSKAFYIREAIINRLDDLEDYYLASEVMENVKQGKERIYSSDDIRKELGLDN